MDFDHQLFGCKTDTILNIEKSVFLVRKFRSVFLAELADLHKKRFDKDGFLLSLRYCLIL